MSLVLLLTAASWACSLAPPEPFVVEPDPSDTEAPRQPVLIESEVTRGKGPEASGCGTSSSTSCDDIGFIRLTLAQPDGDPHDADTVGYAVRFDAGELPDGLEPPDVLWAGPTLVFHWIDGATDAQEPFDFTVSVHAVDAAGNEGPALLVQLRDDGGATALQCGTTPAATFAWPALLLLCAVRRRPVAGRVRG